MMILGDFFVPLTALIFLRLLWSDCVSFFLDNVFFVFSVINAFFFVFYFSYYSHYHLPKILQL